MLWGAIDELPAIFAACVDPVMVIALHVEDVDLWVAVTIEVDKGRITAPAAVAETHLGRERPADVFNAGRAFVVVQDEQERTSFVRCDDVWTVSFTGDIDLEEELSGSDPLLGDLDTEAWLAVRLEDDSVLEGRVRYQLPDANGRVLDFLNQDSPFLTLFQEEQILLVNKRRIARVSELDKSELDAEER